MGEFRLIEIFLVIWVEGYGKVIIYLDVDNNVEEVWFYIVEFWGFEWFICGWLMWEVLVIVQWLCGICLVSYYLVVVNVMDMIVGVDQFMLIVEKMCCLMYYGQVM